jgi:hypothetical protein
MSTDIRFLTWEYQISEIFLWQNLERYVTIVHAKRGIRDSTINCNLILSSTHLKKQAITSLFEDKILLPAGMRTWMNPKIFSLSGANLDAGNLLICSTGNIAGRFHR